MKVLLGALILITSLIMQSKAYACASCIEFYNCSIEGTQKVVNVGGNWVFGDNFPEDGELVLDRLSIYIFELKTKASSTYWLKDLSDGMKERTGDDNFSFSAVDNDGNSASVHRSNETGKLVLISNGDIKSYNLVDCKNHEPEY